MKNYLKFSTFLLSVIFAIAIITSCNKEDEVLLANLDVQVEYATDFAGLSTTNLTITLTNTADNSNLTAITDALGVAQFLNVAPGNYNATTSTDITAEQALEATGYYQEMTLNAAANGLQLVGGVDATETLTLNGQASGDLVIKEYYITGANDPTWGVMFKDQFIEIYNNSAEVKYADGLYIANLAPQANGDNANDAVSTLDFDTYIYADKITKVPGSGTEHPIQPGESIVIAFNAADWTNGGAKSTITVDLSTADFEQFAITWLESLGRTGNQWFDFDNVDVPNMDGIYLRESYNYFGWYSQGSSCAIFKNDNYTVELVDDPESANPASPAKYAKIAVADVIDAIDVVGDENAAAYKKLPAILDAGFTYTAGGSYTSKSLRRLTAKTVGGRRILKDTNNSTNDFEEIPLATPKGF